jgi:small multidrug resistance pump
MKGYIFLFCAIFCETIGTTALNKSEQFTKLTPSLITTGAFILSFYFISFAFKTIPVGISYAIWSAVGIVLIMIMNAYTAKQIPDWPAIFGVTLIIIGVIVINLFSKMSVH